MSPLDRLEKVWLRYHRTRAWRLALEHDYQATRHAALAEQRRLQRAFWATREHARGFDHRYDEADHTWVFEWVVGVGIVVMIAAIGAVLVLLKMGH